MGISQIQPPPRGGFYINPSRRGPVPHFSGNPENREKSPFLAKKGLKWGIPAKKRKKGIFAHF